MATASSYTAVRYGPQVKTPMVALKMTRDEAQRLLDVVEETRMFVNYLTSVSEGVTAGARFPRFRAGTVVEALQEVLNG